MIIIMIFFRFVKQRKMGKKRIIEREIWNAMEFTFIRYLFNL